MNELFSAQIFPLLTAALMGGLIGLEREYRAKGAGLRTHFLVALGAALFMLISQYGFDAALLRTTALHPELRVQADLSRVASQIVSGIGFIGAGTIMLHKRAVAGLTTAASIWTTAAIGAACGGGLWILSCVATLLTLIGLELFSIIDTRLGRAKYELDLVCHTLRPEGLQELLALFAKSGIVVSAYQFQPDQSGAISFSLMVPVRYQHPDALLSLLSSLPSVAVDSVA